MSDVPSFLDRLDRATDYRQLQEVFAEIALLAQADGEHAELARNIDEAVRRLEAERARDERELEQIQSRYESFREENKGVVGWFKRHTPFTQTRRQEGELKGDVAGQEAEILADNLVIARAQMLKERFLGPAQRKLGERPEQWKLKLQAAAAQREAAPLGQALSELAGELERSRAFLKALKHDVDAFANAGFQSADDRQQRDADLATARKELAELVHEVDSKIALKKTHLKQLCARAIAELDTTDTAFQSDGREAGRLQQALSRADAARTSLGALIAAAAPLGKLAEELKELPARMQELRQNLKRLENQRTQAGAELTDKNRILEERRGQYESAQRELDQARLLRASAQQFYDTWLAESGAGQSLPAEAPTESPMWQKLNAAKAAAEAAQSRVNKFASPFEQAKREAETAQSAVQEQTKQVDDLRGKLDTLERRTPELRLELIVAGDRTHVAFAAAATSIGAYLAGERARSAAAYAPHELGAGSFAMLGSHGLERALAESLVTADRDYQRHLQAVQVLNRVNHWLDGQRQAAEQERASAHARREAAWKGRCRQLLGEALANEACAGGLPV